PQFLSSEQVLANLALWLIYCNTPLVHLLALGLNTRHDVWPIPTHFIVCGVKDCAPLTISVFGTVIAERSIVFLVPDHGIAREVYCSAAINTVNSHLALLSLYTSKKVS